MESALAKLQNQPVAAEQNACTACSLHNLCLHPLRRILGLVLASNQRGLQHYCARTTATRTRFKRLYRWNPFDIALLIPYFMVMIILAAYGMHRYQLVYKYYRNKKNGE